MTLFFTSDHHFGHANIIDFSNRPFSSVEQMNEGMVEDWNANVRPQDTVFYLGDIVMGDRMKTLPYIKKLNGNIILIPGNHDHCWMGGRKDFRKWERIYMDNGITAVINNISGWKMQVAGRIILLSHFPYEGDHTEEDRYVTWRPNDEGLFLLHGHSHGLVEDTYSMLDVGVDGVFGYSLVSEDQLHSYFEERYIT